MSLPTYPTYKASGVEWFERLPAHWRVARLAHVGRLLKGSGGSKEDIVEEGVPCVRYGDLYTTHSFAIRRSRTLIAPEMASSYTRISVGDVLFAGSGETFEEIGKSAVNLIEGDAFCGGDLTILRPSVPVAPAFLGYATDSRPSQQQKASMGRGTTVKHIYPDELKNLVIAFPPVAEQAAIGQFLDRETAKIDVLVAEQLRLIELLQEKRQAVISHAITKGLDPDARTKSSGIDWLGDVPAHWEIRSLGSMAGVVRGASPRPAGDPRYFGGDFVPWVTVAEITKDSLPYLSVTDTCLTEEGAGFSRLLRRGTVVYSNSGATLGVPKILEIDACANDGVVGFIDLATDVRPLFLYCYLDSITSAIREKVRQGSGQPNLNTDIVSGLRMALPPVVEQDAILAHLLTRRREFASLTAEAERAIDLLRERRSALVSAAVTGQIDIRGAVPSEAA